MGSFNSKDLETLAENIHRGIHSYRNGLHKIEIHYDFTYSGNIEIRSLISTERFTYTRMPQISGGETITLHREGFDSKIFSFPG